MAINVLELFAKLAMDKSDFDEKLVQAKKQVESFDDKMKNIMSKVGKLTAAGIGATTTAAVAFTQKSITVGQQFDSAMSQVAATMGTTVDNIQDLREFAQKMGSETAFSASQAAEALNYMALAGYDAETSMKMLPNVLNLAAAGGMELARASDMVTDTQSALGLSLEQTEKLVDQMAKASSKTNTNVSQLGEAMLTVGGTAKNLAGGTTELSTVLGLLADNGVKGSEGGTALRNIILALSAPTSTAAKAIKKLGVEVFDKQGKMRDLQSIFADFNSTLSKMTQGEQSQALSDIFNKVDLKSVNALLATNTDRWNEVSVSIDEAKNSAGEMANTQLDNLAGNITLFKSALEGAQIAISDKLTPALNQFVKFGANSLSSLTEKIRTGNTEEIISALQELVKKATEEILKNIPKFVDIGIQLFSAIVQGIIENLPLLVGAVGQIFDSLVNALQDQFPVLEPIFDVLKSTLSLIAEVAESAGNGLKTIWDNFLSKVVGVAWDAFSGFLKGLADTLDRISKNKTAVDALTTIVGSILGIVAAAKTLIGVITLVKSAIEAVSVAGGVANAIFAANPIGLIITAIGALIAVVIEVITYWDYLVLIWDTFVDEWTTGIQAIGREFKKAWDNIVGAFEWFLQQWRDGCDAIWDNVVNAFSNVVGFFKNIWDGIKKTFQNIGQWFSDRFTEAWNNIKNAFSKVGEFFGGIWNSIVSTFSTIGIKVADAIGGAFKAAINGIIWTVEGALNLIPNAVNGAIDLINKLPGVNISTIPTVSLPRLAQGGVLKKGQVGLLEGSGDEAVVPLSQNTEWIDKVAEKLSEKRQIVYYNLEIHIDKMGQTSEDDIEQFAERLMEVMDEKETRRRYVMA